MPTPTKTQIFNNAISFKSHNKRTTVGKAKDGILIDLRSPGNPDDKLSAQGHRLGFNVLMFKTSPEGALNLAKGLLYMLEKFYPEILEDVSKNTSCNSTFLEENL